MIIIILAVFAVLAFWANMTIKSTVTRYVTVTVMFIGLILSVIAIGFEDDLSACRRCW